MTEEEVLETAPPSRWPPWAMRGAIAVLAVAAVVVALIAGGRDDKPRPRPSASSSSTAPVRDDSVRAVVASPGSGQIFAATGDALSERAPDGTVMRQSSRLDATVRRSDRLALALDAEADVVWVVPVGNVSAGAAEAYSTDDLRLVTHVDLPSVATGAAAVDGALYVVADAQLYAFLPGRTEFTASGVFAVVLTADPTRHRVLAANLDNDGYAVRSLTRSGLGTTGTALPVGQVQLTVAAGTIWAADPIGKWLARLDPRTLDPIAPAIKDSTVTLVGTGDASLFVRERAGGPRLRCLDARTGAEKMSWPDASGAVAATRKHVVVAPVLGPARSLDRGGCPG